MSWLVLAAYLLAACGEEPRVEDSGAPVSCAPGYHLDAGTCVPESCGTGAWGDLKVDASTIFVDSAAPEGGDGSEASPFPTIQPALDLAGSRGGGLVAVAAGSYAESLALTPVHADVHLAGRCRALVVLDASGVGDDTPGIDIATGGVAVTISGLAVVDAPAEGIWVRSGLVSLVEISVLRCGGVGIWAWRPGLVQPTEVELEGCLLADNTVAGVVAEYAGTELRLRDCTLSGTLPDAAGEHGYGVQVSGAAALEAVGCEFSRNARLGILVCDPATEAVVTDCSIEGGLSLGGGAVGGGVRVFGGGTLSFDGSTISGAAEAGVLVEGAGSEVWLGGSLVRDSVPYLGLSNGLGVVVLDGAALEAEACEIAGNLATGLLAADPGTEVTLWGCEVRDTSSAPGGGHGSGLGVSSGATLHASGCLVSRNRESGIAISDEGSLVVLRDCTVQDTLPNDDQAAGYGLYVGGGATLLAVGCALLDNHQASLVASGQGTTVALHDMAIRGTRINAGVQGVTALGISTQSGASLEATDLIVSDNEGPGLYVINTGSRLSCSGCELIDNQFAGAAAIEGGALVLSDSRITGSGQNVNLGGGVGVYSAQQWGGGEPSLHLQDCHVSDNHLAGVHLSGEGSFVLVDNEIARSVAVSHGSETRCGDGVYADETTAWDGSDGLLVVGNNIADNQGAGLLLDDAWAALSGNDWRENRTDLVVQGDACLAPRDDWAEVSVREICPEWERPACSLEFGLLLDVTEIGRGR